MLAHDLQPDAYEQGRAAYAVDEELADNPYTPLSPAWNDWRLGWIDASEED
ncbi:hypothetical protein [Burkholderia ubonensis]|uniref:hypothetical protein n=1 Tax=Burkholderia ubonensis TaxID=101571 RepID=UPI000A71B173|nr:hypothetical protein [Burkholderia ubonensis]